MRNRLNFLDSLDLTTQFKRAQYWELPLQNKDKLNMGGEWSLGLAVGQQLAGICFNFKQTLCVSGLTAKQY